MDLYGPILAKALFPAFEAARGRPTVALQRHLEKTQYWPPEALNDLQVGLLRRLMRHAYLHTPHYRALRPEMVELFGEEKASAVERVQLLAWAAVQAHALHVLAADAGPDLVSLAASLGAVRAALVAEVSSLGARRLVTPRQLGKLRGGRGYASLAFDVLQLVSFLDQRWADIESATGYRMEDLHRAEALATSS